MLKHAVIIDLLEVDSEVEALILETNLIKKYRPKYNVRMKDDKSYIWVMFDERKPFPRPEIVREKRIKSAAYFGPYPETFPAKQVLKRLRRIFPYCNTNFKIELLEGVFIGAEKRPCLDTFIGLCSGVCAGRISQAEHKKNIANIRRYFSGQKDDIKKQLALRMQAAAKDNKFELAASLRDQLKNLEYITQKVRLKDKDNEVAVKAAKSTFNIRTQEELKKRLKLSSKKTVSFRIECYDISNIQGTNAVGSMVVFIGGVAAKDQYRKFKIKTKSTPDDFHMMQEVFTRRFKKLDDQKFGDKPDLIIVDGGKGQLHSAWQILAEMKLENEIPIVGLAKREEEIFQLIELDPVNFKKIILAKRSEPLYLVQRIRDEAHRFAIGYHRKLRSRSSAHSLLDDVPGIGYLTKKRLIQAFGSLENIKKASEKELQTVVRNKRTVKAIKKLI
jgi:excinuclease ABC subunit C